MKGSIICSWPWWTDPLTPPLPMKLMKNLLQRALMDKMTRIRSPWTLADRKGSGRGQWTRSFSFIKIWLVHFQVFSILFQNNFRYLVSHILRFWGILVSWGRNSRYIGIPLPPPPPGCQSQQNNVSRKDLKEKAGRLLCSPQVYFVFLSIGPSYV